MYRRREGVCKVFKDEAGSSQVICIWPAVHGGQPGVEEKANRQNDS